MMKALKYIRVYLLACGLVATSQPVAGLAHENPDLLKTSFQNSSAERDGQHDFDFLVGTWKFHLKRLTRRLAGSHDWVEFDGTTVCRKVLDGRGEVEEMNVDNAEKHFHIQGLAMRFYNPASHQWSIYWVNGADGIMEPAPMVGQFSNGRGEFYNQQIYEGKAIYARFVWTDTNTKAPHFEQSFSTDGGKTWEVNWITTQTRVSD